MELTELESRVTLTLGMLARAIHDCLDHAAMEPVPYVLIICLEDQVKMVGNMDQDGLAMLARAVVECETGATEH